MSKRFSFHFLGNEQSAIEIARACIAALLTVEAMLKPLRPLLAHNACIDDLDHGIPLRLFQGPLFYHFSAVDMCQLSSVAPHAPQS